MARKRRKGPNIGVSITPEYLEVAVFNPKSYAIEFSQKFPVPDGLISSNGDEINNLALMADFLKETLGLIRPKIKDVNLAITASLLRLLEMPKMEPKQLYVSLSSEAERYKTFDGTEAVIDFDVIDNLPATPANLQRVVFGAVRHDTFETLRRAFQIAKIKIASVELHPLHSMRAMAGTGVLDSLVQQVGPEAHWGVVFVSEERIHYSIWQANQLIELREVSMDTREFKHEGPDSPFVLDIVDDIQRTAKNVAPVLWLSHNMPDGLLQGVAQHLGVPIRPCALGPGLTTEDPDVPLPAVGAAISPQVEFPFDFNLLVGAAEASVMGRKDAEPPEVAEDHTGANLLVGAGVMTLVLSLLLWGAMILYNNLYLNIQIQDLQAKQQQKQIEVARLSTLKKKMQEKYDLRARIVEIIEQAKIRNAVYVNLAQDLQDMIPGRVWLYNVAVGDDLLVEGKALTHQAVLRFSQQFDHLAYLKAVLIDKIQEEFRNEQKIYTFQINGKTAFPRELIVDPSKEAATTSETSPSKEELESFEELEEPGEEEG